MKNHERLESVEELTGIQEEGVGELAQKVLKLVEEMGASGGSD